MRDVVATLKEGGREGMAEAVAGHTLVDATRPGGFGHSSLHEGSRADDAGPL